MTHGSSKHEKLIVSGPQIQVSYINFPLSENCTKIRTKSKRKRCVCCRIKKNNLTEIIKQEMRSKWFMKTINFNCSCKQIFASYVSERSFVRYFSEVSCIFSADVVTAFIK